MRSIRNWKVDYINLHLVVRGELWNGDRKLFDSFCTHNPTTVNADETECEVSSGNRYMLRNKLPISSAASIELVRSKAEDY